MKRNVLMSQSAEAVNSANSNVVNSNNYFSIVRRVDGSYRSVPTTDYEVLWNNIYEILKMQGNEGIITVNRDGLHINTSLRRNEAGTYSIMLRCSKSVEETFHTEVVTDVKVLRGKNINIIAHTILESIVDAYNEAVVKFSKTEDSTFSTINDTPTLDDTPCLNDEYDKIIEMEYYTGLSMDGLKYVEEKLGDMSEDSFQMMVDDAMTELLEDKYTMEQIYFENYGVKHFVQEELVENLWVNLWFNLMGVTDEALENETREYLKYDEYMDDLLESGAWVMCSNGMGAVHFNEDLACGAEDDSRLMELVGEYIAETEIEKIMRELDDESGAYKFEWDNFSPFFMNRMLGNGNYEWYVKEELKKCTDIADVRIYDDCLYIWATEPKNVNKWYVKVVA